MEHENDEEEAITEAETRAIITSTMRVKMMPSMMRPGAQTCNNKMRS
jgi:hypothetical protein